MLVQNGMQSPEWMTFTEADLHRLSIQGGWVAERASLSALQLESLLAMVKHLIPEDKRAQFKFWLNELFAQCVEDLRTREEILRKAKRSRRRDRQGHSASMNRPVKLSTLVRRELDDIGRAIREVAGSIERLSPSAHNAISTYFWRKRLVGRTGISVGRTFWQTWERAFDVFVLLQMACERSDETSLALSDSVRGELARISQTFDNMTAAIENASEPTREIIESSYDDLECSGDWRAQSKVEVKDACGDAVEWLALLRSVAARPRIEVKKGRDEAAEKQMVRGLAELYRAMTGKEPGRVYRVVETRRGDPVGEAGDFLELARTLAGYANDVLGVTTSDGKRSLSKIVRQILEERRAVQAI